MRRHADEVLVGAADVRRLLRAQFPRWAELPLRPVVPAGTDHTIFRLGDDLTVRMPALERGVAQAEREAAWVPFLAPQVPLALPRPEAMGEPDAEYPFRWSVVRWIDGEPATPATIDTRRAASDLAAFVRALQACDPTGGPPAGEATWGRGLPLRYWDGRLDPWVAELGGYDRLDDAVAVLRAAREAPVWDGPAVWFHGDLSGNLIARDGVLRGVIDSPYGVGDPACDLVPGWILFRGEDRARFFAETGADDATIARARGWAVAPALVGLSYYAHLPHLRANAEAAIEGALAP